MYSPHSSSESPANSLNNKECSSCKHDVDCTFPDKELEIRKESSKSRLSMLDTMSCSVLGCSIHNRIVYTSRFLLPRIGSNSVVVNEHRAFHFLDMNIPQLKSNPRDCLK